MIHGDSCFRQGNERKCQKHYRARAEAPIVAIPPSPITIHSESFAPRKKNALVATIREIETNEEGV